jgi:hypothetical protein
MKNITLSVDEALIEAALAQAMAENTPLNELGVCTQVFHPRAAPAHPR